MPSHRSAPEEAARRARRQLDEVVADLRAARQAAGLSQATVARALGCSAQLVSLLELRASETTPVQLARWAAVLGLDVPSRAYAAGPPLRDAGQLELLRRLRTVLGATWTWRTEVPVSSDPRDRRAFDAVLARETSRVAVEAVVRLTDAQFVTRTIMRKVASSGLERVVLVLAETRQNRRAIVDGAPTLTPAFPTSPRETMRALRAGELPRANGVLLV